MAAKLTCKLVAGLGEMARCGSGEETTHRSNDGTSSQTWVIFKKRVPMEGLLLLLRCGRAQEDNLSEPGAQDPEPSLSDDNIRKGAMMNWDQIAGRWKQSKGKTREGWGRFTDDDSSQIEGRREQMDGFLQESFGMIKELAKKQIHEFLESHPDFYVAHQRTAKQH